MTNSGDHHVVKRKLTTTDVRAIQIRRLFRGEMNPSNGPSTKKALAIVLSCGLALTLLSACATDSAPSDSSGSTSLSPSTDPQSPEAGTGASGSGAGPQTPACGFVDVMTAEAISGQQFPAGRYQINTFGISCDEVMGDNGLFNEFLQLGDDAALPQPWRYLEGAVGAPKFVKGAGVGFRVERISD